MNAVEVHMEEAKKLKAEPAPGLRTSPCSNKTDAPQQSSAIAAAESAVVADACLKSARLISNLPVDCLICIWCWLIREASKYRITQMD